MPFSKDNPPPSRKGRRNKLTGAHGDLIAAWDKVSGPQTAIKIMRAAIAAAVGSEVIIGSADGQTMVKKIVYNFDPLKSILPYIAKKMPETSEFTGGSVLHVTLKLSE